MSFSEPVYDISEDVGLAQFSLHLSNPLSFSITVDVFNTNITALGKHYITLISYGIIVTYYDVTGGGVDYNSGPYPVTIPAGKIDTHFDVMINDDNVLERNKKFNLTINATSLHSRVITGNPDQATVTIVEDDGKYIIQSLVT